MYFRNFPDIYIQIIFQLPNNSHNVVSWLYTLLEPSENSKLFCWNHKIELSYVAGNYWMEKQFIGTT